jgi:pyruvate-ferredoxin/flavodoxin oxidoreductase
VTTWVLTRPNWHVESRAYPIFKYNPDDGRNKTKEAFDLSGNPDMDQDWPTYQLKYKENGREKSMEVPMTFADFAITEGPLPEALPQGTPRCLE